MLTSVIGAKISAAFSSEKLFFTRCVTTGELKAQMFVLMTKCSARLVLIDDTNIKIGAASKIKLWRR